MLAWVPLLQTLMICMIRPFGVMLLLPVTNTRILGGTPVRNAIVLLVALPAVPYASSAISGAPLDIMPLLSIIMTEIAVGFYIGFLAAIPFWAIESAGSLIDMVRGAGLADLLNPTSGASTSLFGLFFVQLISALFFTSGGFNLLLEAIYHSYQLLPIGKAPALDRDTILFIIKQSRVVLDLGIGFALPAVVIMILTDLSLGLVNRATEQLDVFFLAMPIKTLLTCMMLLVGMNSMLPVFVERIQSIGIFVHSLLT